MATKILLTKNNTKLNIDNSNVYSFDNENLKEQFINKEYFNGESYKTLLDQANERGNIWIDSNSISFSMSPDETGYSNLEMLNKNYCIVLEKGKEYFFFITEASKTNENIVLFTGELDIFMTYEISTMFTDKEIPIERAHFPRFDKNTLKPLLSYDNPNGTPEEFDNMIQENNYIPMKNWDFECHIEKGQIKYNEKITDLSYDEQCEMVNKILNNEKFVVVYTSEELFNEPVDPTATPLQKFLIKNKNVPSESTEKKLTYFQSPFYVYVAPVQDSIIERKLKNSTAYVESIYSSYRFLKKVIDDKKVIPNTTSFTNILPFFLKREKDYELKFRLGSVSTSEGGSYYSITYIFEGEGKEGKHSAPYFWNKPSPSSVGEGVIGLFNNYSLDSLPLKLKTPEIIVDTNINNKVDFNQEIKSYKSPYRKFSFTSSTENSFDLLPEYMGDETTIKYNFNYNGEQWNQSFKPNGGVYDAEDQQNLFFNDISNYSIPTEINAWKQYIANNRASSVMGFVNAGVGIATGLRKGPAAPLAVAAGAMSLVNTISKRQDIKHTPNKIRGNGSSIISDIINKEFKTYLTEKSLPNFDITIIQQYFYRNGVNYLESMENVNTLLKTRYYFNFIKVKDIYKYIKLDLSNTIKNLITKALTNGLTIWNVRDLTTFKGIDNYEYNNVEMEIYEKHKK